MMKLEKENMILIEELHRLRYKRLQLRDPEIEPFAQQELVGNTWCISVQDFSNGQKVSLNRSVKCVKRRERVCLKYPEEFSYFV
jgi:hypothetical protein